MPVWYAVVAGLYLKDNSILNANYWLEVIIRKFNQRCPFKGSPHALVFDTEDLVLARRCGGNRHKGNDQTKVREF